MSTVIKVCDGPTCRKNLSQYTFDRAAAELGIEENEKGKSADGNVLLEKCVCMGKCSKGPMVGVQRSGSTKQHERVTPVEMGNIIRNTK